MVQPTNKAHIDKTNDCRVPSNCRFQIDDFEEPWSYRYPFDYIHGRELEGAIRDHDKLFQQALNNLTPNGWFEMASMEVNTHSDDGTHLNARCLVDSVKNLQASSISFGKDMNSVGTWKERFEKVGFINVREDVYKVINGVISHQTRLLTWTSCPRALGLKTRS